ncbi:Gfo/Idh/MocA family protein [Mycolicibacterium goodii]|uniref:Gfo/Idh/MocA family protein n=1 Tax=Mycolicibacterium goodii TaxID=134601 RepID=UPI000C263C95|nr:Gfo/Idh/MocA family oxidoreductase [Mycolicibacterium goodii]PJK18230.1 oxidoreductase [Mycolicibacterium goodii]
MSPRNLRVGVVGCGGISRNHLTAFGSVEGAEVVAVCDIDLEKARATAEKFSVPCAYRSTEEVLGHGVDLVSVCTPHPTHEDAVLAAAAAGVHVLCEKPIATDLVAAERMVRACDDAGVKLGVFLQRRFWPEAQRMRTALKAGELGTPILGECTVLLERTTDYYAEAPWRGKWATCGGGVLMTQAIHHLDLLQWLIGDVAEVYGRVATFRHSDHIEVEDSAVATLFFTSGAMATLQASTAVNPSLGAQVRVTTSSGASVQLTEFPEGTDGRMDIWAKDGRIRSEHPFPASADPHVVLADVNRRLMPHHTAQVADFVAAVRSGQPPAVCGEDATRALRTLLAIYESSRTGQVVPVSG